MKAEIISVGTELLLGSTVNTDAADVAVLLSEYGDLTVALCAYNAGMGNVASWLSDSAYSDDAHSPGL